MSGMTTGNTSTYEPLSSVYWGGDHLVLLDQRLLPEEIVYLKLYTPEEVWEGIHSMKVRGAPAIGIAAAFGAVLGECRWKPMVARIGFSKSQNLRLSRNVQTDGRQSVLGAGPHQACSREAGGFGSRHGRSERGAARRSRGHPGRGRGCMPPHRRERAAVLPGRHGRAHPL